MERSCEKEIGQLGEVYMEGHKLVCLQIHNDYQVPGGETKTAHLIADLLERNGIKVIRYYRTNMEFAGERGIVGKLKVGIHSLNNPNTKKEISEILDKESVDFALVHNVIPVISNTAYKVMINRKIPIIKYLQNYNLVCLNGALDHGNRCDKCQHNNLVGVKCKCYKESTVYSFIKYLIKRDMDNNILPHITAFMPNSEYVMMEHVKRGIDERKMHVMYNYVDIPQLPYEGTRGYYLYFGRLTREKGVLTTIDAFEKMPDKKLVIMGSGTLENEIKLKSGNGTNIEFIGSCEGSKLLEYVAKAKAAIVPSEWDEPLPRTILEAYSQGTPVIGANRGGIPELIEEGKTGFIFQAGSVESMIKAIQKIEELSVVQYEEIRTFCLNRLNKEYTEAAYFKRFMDCVEDL